jgi:hypothetical protein
MATESHAASRTIESSITINAPMAQVRAILLDFAQYPSWSKFIQSIEVVGTPPDTPLAIGQKLKVSLLLPGGNRDMVLTPTLVHLDDSGFGWQGHLANVNGLFDGKHLFLLSEEGGGSQTKLTHREEFGGLLYTPLMSWLGMGAKTRAGFEAFNEALKTRAAQVA